MRDQRAKEVASVGSGVFQLSPHEGGGNVEGSIRQLPRASPSLSSHKKQAKNRICLLFDGIWGGCLRKV